MHTTNPKETAMNKQLHRALVSHLKNEADDTAVIGLHNEHASADDYVYTSIEDIADVFATDDPTKTKIARMVYFGNVQSWNDRFFCLNGYGNIDSFSHLTDARCPIDFKLLAEQIIDNEQFGDVNFDADLYLSDDE